MKLTVKTVFKTISKGSKNHAMVKKIQKALIKKGYYKSSSGKAYKVDGNYGDLTVKAVKQFQNAKKLKVTGKVDEKTKVDGNYRDFTVKAVKQFQKAKKLKVTGKVDEKTAKKLGII